MSKNAKYSVKALGRDFLTILSKICDALNDHEQRLQALEAQYAQSLSEKAKKKRKQAAKNEQESSEP